MIFVLKTSSTIHLKLPLFEMQPEITWLKVAFNGHSYFSSERVHIII